jgi:hypothetical protein
VRQCDHMLATAGRVGQGRGLPLAIVLSAANANDATMFEAVLDDIPPILMPNGRRLRRPDKVHADKAVRHEAPCDRVG